MFYPHVTTICASKYFDAKQMRQLHEKGVIHVGENRVQDMLNKMDDLHTLDRLSLAEQIQKYATHQIPCFIQVNLTDEPQKSGISPANLGQFLIEIKKYDKIEIIGLMTMGKDEDDEKTEEAFHLCDELAKTYNLPYRSMGIKPIISIL